MQAPATSGFAGLHLVYLGYEFIATNAPKGGESPFGIIVYIMQKNCFPYLLTIFIFYSIPHIHFRVSAMVSMNGVFKSSFSFPVMPADTANNGRISQSDFTAPHTIFILSILLSAPSEMSIFFKLFELIISAKSDTCLLIA